MSTVGTTTSQTYLPGLTATLTSIVSANLIVNGGAYLPVEQRLYSTGNWTRPSNIANWIKVTLIGGGGSGGSATSWNYTGAGGGGAGQYLVRYVDISTVAAGANIPVTIGTGGAAVGGNSVGNDGADSTFGVNGNPFYLISYGGGGGGYAQGWGRSGRYGTNGTGAATSGGGSGGGGGGYWQNQYNGAGGGGGAGGAGGHAYQGTYSAGTGYTGYGGGRGGGNGGSDGGTGNSNGWGQYHTWGGLGGLGINGLAGGGGGGGGARCPNGDAIEFNEDNQPVCKNTGSLAKCPNGSVPIDGKCPFSPKKTLAVQGGDENTFVAELYKNGQLVTDSISS